MSAPRPFVRAVNRVLLSKEQREKLQQIPVADAGYGYDQFGLDLDHVGLGIALSRPVYESYFRVQSHGAEKVPRQGPVIVAANHSGTLPFDAAMLWNDLVRHVGRVPRGVADNFVPTMPFIWTLFARAGAVGGSRGNVRALLDAGELLMIFPEGVPGIGKPFRDRYRLQEWRVGHAELAIRHQAKIVPAAIVGAEEQMPQLGRLEKLGRLFGYPYIPIPATLLPLPVRYHIYYGDPLDFSGRYQPDDADDLSLVQKAAAEVAAEVEKLIARGLKERKGIFR